MNAKIRDAQNQRIPYMAIVGQREQESGTVSIRLRTGDQESGIPLEVFAARVLEKIQTKSLDL
ncbi:MAG TPA: His/Gly/Thr/Pro-type tRNA ligase C-terminal domain-containing protein, partial [Rectinema sp.]|nr:His/Gly/Thr/Pro-type tRNA ligase C-terminal domain-containing protein [Rectinema sp.]